MTFRMDRKQKVLLMLKPKVKAFGFNRKELQGIAVKIADNLTSADDAYSEVHQTNTYFYITKLLFYTELRAAVNKRKSQ